MLFVFLHQKQQGLSVGNVFTVISSIGGTAWYNCRVMAGIETAIAGLLGHNEGSTPNLLP